MIVHCKPAKLAPRSSPIDGRAILTTVASMPATPDPSTVASSTHRPEAWLRLTCPLTVGPTTISVTLPSTPAAR